MELMHILRGLWAKKEIEFISLVAMIRSTYYSIERLFSLMKRFFGGDLPSFC
jgi:hypothetical protein